MNFAAGLLKHVLRSPSPFGPVCGCSKSFQTILSNHVGGSHHLQQLVSHTATGGGRWIRTTEGVSQQIYSLPPLAAWVSLQKFAIKCGTKQYQQQRLDDSGRPPPSRGQALPSALRVAPLSRRVLNRSRRSRTTTEDLSSRLSVRPHGLFGLHPTKSRELWALRGAKSTGGVIVAVRSGRGQPARAIGFHLLRLRFHILGVIGQ